MITAVTSFSPTGWEQYGREGVASLVKYWPGKVIAYVEGAAPEDLPKEVEFRNLYALKGVPEILDWAGKMPLLRGIMPDGDYNYHINFHKFSRKVFAICDELMKENGLVYWVDADVVLSKDVPEEFLAGLLKDVFTCYLGRKDFDHTETGIVGYDTSHEWNKGFASNFLNLFFNAYILCCGTIGFHDCYGYDYILAKTDIPARNLTEDAEGMDVFSQSPFAEYMVHHKGAGKKKPKKEVA